MPGDCAKTKKTAFTAFSGEESQCLSSYEIGSGNLVEGRVDNVKGVNLRRSLDKSCQRLQCLRVGIRVVLLGVCLIFPQTDCGHINSTGTSEGNFVLKSILFTK